MADQGNIPGSEPIADWWDDIRVAVAFMTRLPVDRLGPPTGAHDLSRASRAFPLVGLLIGALSALAYAIAVDLGLTALLAGSLAVATGAIATGALHEDGLADVADALGARGDATAKLAAMRDSHIGVFGTLALVFSILFRVVALAALAQPAMVAAGLLAAHAGSRAWLPWAMHRFGRARVDGLAVAAGRPSRTTAYVALGLGAAALLIFAGPARAIVAAGASALALLLVPLARRQFGGVTGDVLGAIEQVAEIAILLSLVATR